jgi:NADPH:quinone reductase-like Zn-dependent oxidoreductase
MTLFLKGLIDAGRYRPVIDRSYSLAGIVDAHRYVDTGQKIGNVVVEVNY